MTGMAAAAAEGSAAAVWGAGPHLDVVFLLGARVDDDDGQRALFFRRKSDPFFEFHYRFF